MFKSKKIVVVDDELMITELVGDVLKGLGGMVEVTNDPQKAMGLIKKFSPDMIILDRQMPQLSGLDILKKIKDDLDCQDIPVVMLTAANKETEIKEAIKAGAKGYVIKPFKPKDLVKQIQTVIEKEDDIWYVG